MCCFPFSEDGIMCHGDSTVLVWFTKNWTKIGEGKPVNIMLREINWVLIQLFHLG